MGVAYTAVQKTIIGLLFIAFISVFMTVILLNQDLRSEVYAETQPVAQKATQDIGSELFSEVSRQNYTPRSMVAPYTPGTGNGPLLNQNAYKVIAGLGYSAHDVWKSGIYVVAYDGLIEKHCGAASGYLQVSGLAIKPNVSYASCPDGKPVIPASFRTPGKCTIHFNANEHTGLTEVGNSRAIFAHELGHCLYFIYGDAQGMHSEYLQIRKSVSAVEAHQQIELFADDYMMCRHNADTAWGEHSYSSLFKVDPPTRSECRTLNQLYAAYFPL